MPVSPSWFDDDCDESRFYYGRREKVPFETDRKRDDDSVTVNHGPII